LLAACGSGSGGEAAVPDDPVLARGQQVYKDNCARCHGAKGGGGAGVKLAGVVAARYPDISDHEAVIENGKGGNMPSFKNQLSPEDIEAVARWEREGL
jgi:mono/diheme cytochrome c family protein